MKIVFSRKGVDSAAGRCASALVDGRPVSLPIPANSPTPTRYGDLDPERAALAADLSRGRLGADTPCHLDPDIEPGALAGSRPEGWRGALGQTSAALSHLRNNGVGAGDLFLFWGLFRPAERKGGRWRYAGPRVHALYGWLEIARAIDLGEDGRHALAEHPWLERHPHVREGWERLNAIYLATDRLSRDERLPGSGIFARAVPLTASDAATLTDWRVPDWLHPLAGGTGMTYHPGHRWREGGRLTAAPRGQEFVADIGERADARRWLARLFAEAGAADA